MWANAGGVQSRSYARCAHMPHLLGMTAGRGHSTALNGSAVIDDQAIFGVSQGRAGVGVGAQPTPPVHDAGR